MSLVVDQVYRVNVQLNRLQLLALQHHEAETKESPLRSAEVQQDDETSDDGGIHGRNPVAEARIAKLQSLLKSLEAGKSGLIPPRTLRNTLHQAKSIKDAAHVNASKARGEDVDPSQAPNWEEPMSKLETELHWLLLSKATYQTCGLMLSTILNQTIPLSSDIWYWDEVLGSSRWTTLYSVQTAPSRLINWGKEILKDVRARQSMGIRSELRRGRDRADEGWRKFYNLVHEVVVQRNAMDIRGRLLSPVFVLREEVRAKKAELKRLKLIGANALGLLLNEAMAQGSHFEDDSTNAQQDAPLLQEMQQKWYDSVPKAIRLMDSVLQVASDPEISVDKFDDAVGAAAHESGDRDVKSSEDADQTHEKLLWIVENGLPTYQSFFDAAVQENGKPPAFVRYWPTAVMVLVSSSTILRIVANRKAEILAWISELGVTVRDFWYNWVVEPTRKVIGTIRHDEGSEISIMSKRSLEGDRDSLERMVVDFALDNHTGPGPGEAEVAALRKSVHEGDLTPVLRAYEKDMQSPFTGVVRGNLIRTVLIQVQKTKVDVEVALGGIDSMLKSQELVFGFIGLTPGVLVCIGLWTWLRSSLSAQRRIEMKQKEGELVRVLRNIDRILTAGRPTEYGELLYKDQGLLLCEVHVLRQSAQHTLPPRIFAEFVEEVDELVDVRMGIDRQRRVVDRIRWAYARWL